MLIGVDNEMKHPTEKQILSYNFKLKKFRSLIA